MMDIITETSLAARQRLYKHVSAATDTHAKIDELLKAMFSMRSVRRLYSEGHREMLASNG
jgi:hypothetical protein